MSHFQFSDRPDLRRPVLIAAFSGWNDAADAASSAASYLGQRWGARRFARLDPEEFFDFTVTRPDIVHTPQFGRQIVWPEVVLAGAAMSEASRDVVVLSGPEPQLRWRTVAAEVVEAVRSLGVDYVLTLGALLADVAHRRPVPVTASTSSDRLSRELGLEPSRYSGPTGIVGVLHDALGQAGIPSCSLWAAVPHYVSSSPSPKAALALVEEASRLVGVPVMAADLAQRSADYEVQIDELVADDEDLAGYVARLEERSRRQPGAAPELNPLAGASGEELAADVERFLREQGK